MGIEYAAEKMSQVLRVLTGPEPLSERLAEACIPAFTSAIHDSADLGYLPEELQERMQRLLGRLTAEKPEGSEGKLLATLGAMSLSDLADCSEEMTRIAIEIIEHVEPLDG